MDTTRQQNDPTRADSSSEGNAPYIVEYPGVCGGYPVIEKMRFPVRVVVEAYRAVGDVEKVAELYPQLTRAQIQCGLDYYATSPGRVDEDIRRNARECRDLLAAAQSSLGDWDNPYDDEYWNGRRAR